MATLPVPEIGQDVVAEEIDDGMWSLRRTSAPEPITPDEIEEVEPIEKSKGLTKSQMEDRVPQIAARLMDEYIEKINDTMVLNPIRDGIPQCRRHPFKSGSTPGCYHGCTDGLLPRAMDQTLGDVFAWVKGVVGLHYDEYVRKYRPDFKGYAATL